MAKTAVFSQDACSAYQTDPTPVIPPKTRQITDMPSYKPILVMAAIHPRVENPNTTHDSIGYFFRF